MLLAYRMPREPSRPRIAVWRKLERLGVARVGDGLVALPEDPRTREQFDWLAEEIGEAGGSAPIWSALPGTMAQEQELITGMRAARQAEYQTVIDEAATAADASDARPERVVRRLWAELRRITQRDYFPPTQHIMVVQFVAFLGAYHNPGPLDPWTAGIVASLLTTWVTFVPCFIFILLGAPHVERLRGNQVLSAALTGITAAVVGVIANLGLYFAVHTLFRRTLLADGGPLHMQLPDVTTIRWTPVAITAVAVALIFTAKWSVLRVLGVAALLGLAAGLAGLPGV